MLGDNVKEAVDARRFHHQLMPMQVRPLHMSPLQGRYTEADPQVWRICFAKLIMLS
jgi:hypothetical protein